MSWNGESANTSLLKGMPFQTLCWKCKTHTPHIMKLEWHTDKKGDSWNAGECDICHVWNEIKGKAAPEEEAP